MSALTIGSFFAVRIIFARANTGMSSPGAGKDYKEHYAFIHTDGEDDLWDNIFEGARQKGEELGVCVEYFGKDLTVNYSTDELMNIAVMSGVDGIIVDGGGGTGDMTELINSASKKGIPVVTVMSDSAESDRICFVGVSSYTMGRQYGAQILKHYSGDNIRIYVVMDYERESSGQDLVISGIYDEFADKGLIDKCVIEGIYVHDESAFNAEEDIRSIFMGRALPDACVALNSVYTKCLFQAVVDYNKVGDIYLYGFNDSPDILEAVRKDLLEATISVNASKLGESAVDALFEYIDTGYVSNYITQDTRVILAQDVRSANEETD